MMSTFDCEETQEFSSAEAGTDHARTPIDLPESPEGQLAEIHLFVQQKGSMGLSALFTYPR